MPETKSSTGDVLYTAGTKAEKFEFVPIACEYIDELPSITVIRSGILLYTEANFPVIKNIPAWSAIDLGYLTGSDLPTQNLILGLCFPYGGQATSFALAYYPNAEGKPKNLIQIISHWEVSPTDRWFHIRNTIFC